MRKGGGFDAASPCDPLKDSAYRSCDLGGDGGGGCTYHSPTIIYLLLYISFSHYNISTAVHIILSI